MRKFTLLIFALIIAATVSAQEPRTVYGSLQASGLSYSFDYGQQQRHRMWLVDDSGKTIYFCSTVCALNYMSERGWRFIESHTTVGSNIIDPQKIESSTVWILSKEITSPEEITEGITTRQMYIDQHPEE